MRVPYGSAVSENADSVAAAAEVADAIVEQMGLGPDAAMVFFTGPHVQAAEEMAREIRDHLLPGVLAGASAVAVVAGEREIETRPAVSLWAGNVGDVAPARFTFHRDDAEMHIKGPGSDTLAGAHTLILVPDPYTFPADLLVRGFAAEYPDLTVIGGFASAAFQAGGNRLFLDDEVYSSGAVGLLLSGSTRITTVVSQGCRPIGDPLVVTRAEGNVIHELAGRPAYRQLVDLFNSLEPEEKALAQHGLHIGRVIDEHKSDFNRGDFLIRGVMAADQETGTVTVGDVVPVGTSVQFQVRDSASADEDLRELIHGRSASGALLFTCNGRGTNMFSEPDHDASLISTALDGVPLGGMFCAGELGPVGDENFVHGYTASLALFHD